MKKNVLFTIVILLFNIITYSQGCLPEGITFSTQENIDNFQSNYPGCNEIEGDVTINGDDITNLNGLSILNKIDGSLKILVCNNLTTLSGLDSLSYIGGDLFIQHNESLTNLIGLNNLTYIGEVLYLNDLQSLTDLLPLENLTHTGGIGIIKCNELINFSGLNNITSINGTINIQNNNSLINFEGLNNLTSIQGTLLINSNSALENFEGLNSLTDIDALSVSYCPSLINLEGLNSLNSIENNIEITCNVMLNSLAALNSVNSEISVLILYSNDALSSLYGLGNITFSGYIDFFVYDNSSLSNCDVESICNIIPNYAAIMQVYNNAYGCNSVFEIEAACQTGISNSKIKPGITLFLNSTGTRLFIAKPNRKFIKGVKIYNTTGQQILQIKNYTEGIDVSTLNKGLYIAEVETNSVLRQKFIVK